MELNETALRDRIRAGTGGLYMLYGEESYLTEQYVRLIVRRTVEDETLDAFNCQRFDGQEISLEQLEEAVEALPMMAERKCVTVRDMDIAAADGARLAALIAGLPESCVLVFWQVTTQPDRRKGWQDFLKQAAAVGCVAKFDRRTAADAAKLLVSGARKRGCTLAPEDARLMVERTGSDLHLLLNELDKLVALATDGVITRRSIEDAGVCNLEARVFDLSREILRGRTGQAYLLLGQLLAQREEPLAILGTLSTALADLYRAKVAAAAGVAAETLAADFKSYKGKEFRLRNAARDAGRMSIQVLRDSLDILAEADTALKQGRAARAEAVLLEQTVARLTCRAQEA